ncbi:MAG: amino acid permease [Metamycoplasmataceae bacterium]
MSQKTFNIKGGKIGGSKISIFAMVCIAILAIFSFQNVIDNYVGMGLSASIAFLIATITFMVPFIFMIAEFASLKKSSKSGLTSWIHTAVGRKTAFVTSFMFWFANLTYFFSAVPARINFLSFAVTGQDFTGDAMYKLAIPFVTVAFFALITFVSTLNTKKLSKIISLGGTLMLALTAFFFIMAMFGWIAVGIDPTLIPDTEAPGITDNPNIWGETGGLNFAWMSTFIWVLMAADGGQSLGVYVKDVNGGKRAFVKAMMISVLAIGGCYIVGTLLVSVFPPVGGLAAGWANSFASIFRFILSPMGVSVEMSQQLAYIIMGSIFFITSIGGLIIWTSAPVKVMFSEIAPGIFGSKLSKQNKNGVCSYGAWLQFILVIPFLMLLTWPIGDGNFSENLHLIKGAAGWIGMLPWLVIFISYINLRWKKDHEERTFKMGNRKFGMFVGIFLTFLTSIILVITFLDTTPLEKPFNEWQANWWLGPLMKVSMILLIVVPAYLWYYFKYEYQLRDTKISIANNLPLKYSLIKYSLSSKFVLWLNPQLYLDFIEKKNYLLMNAEKNFKELNEKIKNELDLKIVISERLEKAVDDGNFIEVKKQSLAESKEISIRIRNLKKEIRNNKKVVSQEVALLKKEYKISLKAFVAQEKAETKQFYQTTLNPLIAEYKNKKILKELWLSDVQIFQEKDIEIENEAYSDYESFSASSYYTAFQQFRLEDKIAINNEEMIIMRNFAGQLTGEKLALQNLVIFKETVDKNIQTIVEGKYEELELISFIHVENNQFEDFKVYVKDSDSFITSFNKLKTEAIAVNE